MKKIYLFFHHFTFYILAIAVAFVFLLTQNYLVSAVAQKYLKEYGIEYSRIEGTLLQGVILHDLKYKDALSIKKLQVKYNILYFFRPTPKISKVKADELYLNVDKLTSSDNNQTQVSLISFAVSNLELGKAKVIYDNESYAFDLKAKGFYFDREVDVDKLTLDFNSSYVNAIIKGTIKSNEFEGDSSVEVPEYISKKYLSFLRDTPKTINVKIKATTQEALFSTELNNLTLKENEDLVIKEAKVDLSYSYNDNKYTSTINATLKEEPIKLPFKKISAEIFADEKSVKADIKAGTLDFNVTSKDYENFIISGGSDKVDLSFLGSIPKELQADTLSFKTKAYLQTSPFLVKGRFNAQDSYAKTNGDFEIRENHGVYKATLYPKLENNFYKKYPVKLFSPLKIKYENLSNSEKLNIDANLLHATLTKKHNSINGYGTLASSKFTLSTKADNNRYNSISINTKIPSIKKILSELKLSSRKDTVVHDGEAEIQSTLNFGENFSMKNDIRMPWYTITIDSENTYLVKNIFLSSVYANKKLTINSYKAKYMQQKFYSDKQSTILIDENKNIQIKEFWLYDNLLATGFMDTTKKVANIHLQSDKFKYIDKDISVSAKADLHASIDSFGKQKIEGSITLLDGVINYIPIEDYTTTDKDIIVIQDIKKNKNSNKFIHITINSLKPITYKTKEINVHFTPNIVIQKEVNKPLKLLGMVTIHDGEITHKDKTFVFDKSEVYFNGKDPIDPQLNLNLHYYTVDNIDIEIFITNTLSSPVIIFSSKPVMSQNDIMSYILFGEPASSLFESSDGFNKTSAGSLLLGTGLKQIFSDTAGVKIDTLNILTNKEGTMGYEIGSRFNKDIRIVYKNDTASSVILQYSLSRSLRVDVDVVETGQGVNIIYVKDF